jgi:hypothetical protein
MYNSFLSFIMLIKDKTLWESRRNVLIMPMKDKPSRKAEEMSFIRPMKDKTP